MTLRLIGIGGLGKMLGPSALHLKDAKIARYLRIYDRGAAGEYRDECRKAWRDHGAELVSSFDECIGDGDFDGIVICAGKNGDDYKIIKEIISRIKNKKKYFILHFSTVSLAFVRTTFEFCQRNGILYANYPLTGGAKGAASAKMLILASGDHGLYERVLPMLNAIGVPKYFGEDITRSSAVKFIGHVMVFHGLLGISLAAVLHKNSFGFSVLNAEQIEFFDFLNNGAGGTKQWDVMLRSAIQNNNWQDGFLLKHAVIDVIYTLELMRENKIPTLLMLPMVEAALLFAFLLQQPNGEGLATSAVADLIDKTPPDTIDDFLKKAMSLEIDTCIKNCVLALPEKVQETLMLAVCY